MLNTNTAKISAQLGAGPKKRCSKYIILYEIIFTLWGSNRVKCYVIQMLNLCIYPVLIGLGFHPPGYPAMYCKTNTVSVKFHLRGSNGKILPTKTAKLSD